MRPWLALVALWLQFGLPVSVAGADEQSVTAVMPQEEQRVEALTPEGEQRVEAIDPDGTQAVGEETRSPARRNAAAVAKVAVGILAAGVAIGAMAASLMFL